MAKIFIDTQGREHTGAPITVLNPHLVSGQQFERFIDQQKAGAHADGTISSKGLTDRGAAELREKSFDILSHCNPHDATSNPQTTHLVVGYVQSGKTMSFTALSALAYENGYRVVIYLAGTKKNLLEQTTERLKRDLVGKDLANRKAFAIFKDPQRNDTEQIAGSLCAPTAPILLLPILKHYKHIGELTEIFKDTEIAALMSGETVLIIDDEADQSSLNNFGRKNSKNDGDETSSTYDAILKLRAQLPGNSYVQYTATPQANLLISMQDMLAPQSHTLLNPGEGYVGGKLFFGMGEGHRLFRGRLIVNIPDEETYHPKANPLKTIPRSLVRALIHHVLSVAIVVGWMQKPDIGYLSMMVHPDSRKQSNKMFKNWIDSQLRLWRRCLLKEDGHDDKEHMMRTFRNAFPQAVSLYDEEERPTFEEVRPFIREVLCNYKTYLVNTDKDAETTIDWDQYQMHVLVGAEMLNRGFTVQNLSTTYMPRYSTSKANADTIEQRCRFFGYKMDYIKSCRVFLPRLSIENYRDYIRHEEELRSMLANNTTLDGAVRNIMLTERLKPTRLNVLPISLVNVSLQGMKGMLAFESRYVIEHNDSVVAAFLDKNKDRFDLNYDYHTPERRHRGMKLPVDEAVQFLADFRFGNAQDAIRKSNTIRYLNYLVAERKVDGVYFIQMAYEAERYRSFDKDTKLLETGRGFFAGRSPNGDSQSYPGDEKIVGDEDTITIQLHHFHLKGAAVDFPKAGYTLGIYYPESLATNYCGDSNHFTEWDEDFNEEDEES